MSDRLQYVDLTLLSFDTKLILYWFTKNFRDRFGVTI